MKTAWMANPPKDWQNLKYHPLSECCDFGDGIDLEAAAEHMRTYGYDENEAIVLDDGMILDGRHRHKIAIIAGVVPSFRRYVGTHPEAYVQKKMFRQHLTASKRAQFAVKLIELKRAKGQPISQQAAADMAHVSLREVQLAEKVETHGTAELKDAVKAGTITVPDAANVADKPKDVQKKAVSRVKHGEDRTVTAAAKVVEGRSQFDDGEEEEPKEVTLEDTIRLKNQAIESFCRGLMKFVNDNAPKDEWLSDLSRGESAIKKISDACTTFRSAKCHAACPLCQGEGCPRCHQTGRVPKQNFEMYST